ncbi:hypothetical protein SDRG_13294 [Saprolegnia diclina VS20]|uniref:Ubiquitin-like domain-containing protein n=1 Tax=Saprolegnia diclina (strain VS20) TaxID=1156394 RepID=T0RGQ8_SAPDV|nr:hypothetical protein SDRG_13294 [Saprolegnia diclina VS20]EQC28957.1 hypothetical protein SDRG_13294 [Saprolegnia diclina VS20]|eukprot:XP_008617596.1 hypothetical protein SDRG_13294 [Saprolegnia diclina VS20]
MSLTGETTSLDDILSSTLMMTITKMIRDRTGQSVSTQRMIYAGKQLWDEKALLDDNIKAGCTLHIVKRLRGGGMAAMFTDVTNDNAMRSTAFSSSAPSWRD